MKDLKEFPVWKPAFSCPGDGLSQGRYSHQYIRTREEYFNGVLLGCKIKRFRNLLISKVSILFTSP